MRAPTVAGLLSGGHNEMLTPPSARDKPHVRGPGHLGARESGIVLFFFIPGNFFKSAILSHINIDIFLFN